MFGARRRSVPLRLLKTSLATWAAKAGHDFGDTPARQESRRQVRPDVPRTTFQDPTAITLWRFNFVFRSRLRHAYEVAMRTK